MLRRSAIATIAGAVVTGGDRARADRPERADASAQCGIPIAAITANSRDLGCGLIKVGDVRLIGVGCRMGAGLRHVERLESSVAPADQAPGKIAVAAIAGAVFSRVGREVWPRIRGKPPRAWCIVPERILDAEVTAARYTPNTHGCYPTEIASRRLDGRSRTQERMSPRQAKSRVVNSDRKRSDG